jgi:hypothetical protein
MARPRIEIDKEQFKKLCQIQCTLSEIASWFKCSEDTIERWCQREFKMHFAEAFKTYSADGKISLRRWTFRSVEAGNVSMQIWLGKQYLGQKEVQDVQLVATTDETIRKMDEYFKRTGFKSDKVQSD